ncbi:MAG TPA: hypothetical protein VFS43_38510 [Polyangiaceae bacterium]|nr:hypothetical protein [Polyangiaceae bacterium]
MKGGYVKLVTVAGVPVRAHVSLPLGMLWVSHARYAPGLWLGFITLILLHEAGHALLARRAGLRVFSVNVHALGGDCRFDGGATPRQHSVIAWGGVLAQALAFAACHALLSAFGPPRDAFTAGLVRVYTHTNLWLMGLNLLPVPPLDGAEAWRLFARLGPARRGGALSAVAARRHDRGLAHPPEYFRYKEGGAGGPPPARDEKGLAEVQRLLDEVRKGHGPS